MNVVVVGAGVVGYAVAYELAARGARVQILDPRGTGLGATRASAGMLAPYIEGHVPALLELGVLGLDEYDPFTARVAADAGSAIEYRRIGTLQAARTSEQAAELEHHGRWLREAGVRQSLLTASETRRLEPNLSSSVKSALLIPEHGYVGVASLMAALVAAAARHGATTRNRRVTGISSEGGVRVSLEGGDTINADAAVVAAGSWSGAVSPGINREAVHPVRGQLVELRAVSGALSHVIWGADCYLVPWTDGTVLVGATMEHVGFDERTTEEGVSRLRRAAGELTPALESAAFVDARAGLRPATRDELPIVGPSSTMRGVFYATGHFRNGVLLAPLTARLIAELILDGGSSHKALALVRPDRFGW